MKNSKFILKEGHKKIAITLVVAIFLSVFGFECLNVLAYILTFILLYIYRVPNRYIYSNTESVLAPMDAKIIAIDNKQGKTKIYCQVGLWDSHILRAPVGGEMKIKKYQHGLNLNPNCYKASLLNEQLLIKFDNVKLKVISGFCNSEITYSKNENVTQGEEIGVFIQGLVVLTVKSPEELKLQIGDKVKAGEAIVCY